MENWQEFVYTENEKSILVKWNKKDFVAYYDCILRFDNFSFIR